MYNRMVSPCVSPRPDLHAHLGTMTVNTVTAEYPCFVNLNWSLETIPEILEALPHVCGVTFAAAGPERQMHKICHSTPAEEIPEMIRKIREVEQAEQ